jgi:hypothetical protein
VEDVYIDLWTAGVEWFPEFELRYAEDENNTDSCGWDSRFVSESELDAWFETRDCSAATVKRYLKSVIQKAEKSVPFPKWGDDEQEDDLNTQLLRVCRP